MQKNISQQNRTLFFVGMIAFCVFVLAVWGMFSTTRSAFAQTTVIQDMHTIQDGALIRQANNPDVYIVKIVNGKAFKRLILNPEIFNSYGHLSWDTIVTVTPSVVDAYQTSHLVMEVYADGIPVTGRVYVLEPYGDIGVKRYLALSKEQFESAGYDRDSIYFINHVEASDTFYRTGEPITYNGDGKTISAHPEQENTASQGFNKDQREDCTQEWLEATKQVLETIEVIDGLCVELVSKDSAVGKFILSMKVSGFYLVEDNKIVVIEDRGLQTVFAEIHEVCHAQQNWYFKSFYKKGDVLDNWIYTKAGREFLDITGFESIQQGRNRVVWTVPSHSPFFGMYGYNNPIELAAEICTLSFFWKHDVQDVRYDHIRDELADLLRVGKTTGVYAWMHRWVIGQNQETLRERETQQNT